MWGIMEVKVLVYVNITLVTVVSFTYVIAPMLHNGNDLLWVYLLPTHIVYYELIGVRGCGVLCAPSGLSGLELHP